MTYRFLARARRASVAILLLASVLAVPAAAEGPAREAQQIVDDARDTLARFMDDPEFEGFRSLLPKARGLMIIPQQNKGGFILAGSGGAGLLVAYDDLHESWSAPVFYRMGSASVGFQIGGSRSEVILLFMSQRSVDAMLGTSTRLGGEISVAAGPIGKGSGEIGADIVS
jgi:lipid-binding SYLF domain-containing protein